MDHAYLKIDQVKGECTVDGFADQVEVDSFSYGCSQPTSPVRSNEGPTTGRVSHHMMSFSKRTDLSTPDICKHVWQGSVLKEAVLTICRMDNNVSIPYLVITLSDVVIADFSISGGGGGVPGESFAFNYSKIKFDYIQQKKEGQKSGTNSIMHDLKTNQIS